MKANSLKPGDVVISLSDPSSEYGQPRKKGNIYIVFDVRYCEKCGVQMVNITTKRVETKKGECGCGKEFNPYNRYWTASEHFIKKEHLKDRLQEAVEEENYEIAAEIRDIIGLIC